METRGWIYKGNEGKGRYPFFGYPVEKDMVFSRNVLRETIRSLEEDIVLKKFSLGISYMSDNIEIYSLCWKRKEKRFTFFKSVMRFLMLDAIVERDGNVTLERSKVRHAQGNLKNGRKLRADMIRDRKIVFSWEFSKGTDVEEPEDMFCIVTCATDTTKAEMYVTGAMKKECGFVYKIPPKLDGKEIAVYGLFIRERNKRVSDDKFLGLFKIN